MTHTAWKEIAESVLRVKDKTPKVFALCVPKRLRDTAVTINGLRLRGMRVSGVLIGSIKQ